jgi:hypothetical protein
LNATAHTPHRTTLPDGILPFTTSAGTTASINTLRLSQQARLGALGTGAFGGGRAFVERFNALSAWVTSSVLEQTELQARADRVIYYARLAGHLAELASFHALVAVLSALQQACVTRLKWTWELVPKADKDKLARLQVR